MANGGINRLPLEIHDAIIGQLRGNKDQVNGWSNVAKKDLWACSLVCRTWKFITQAYLFRDIGYTFCQAPRARSPIQKLQSFLQENTRLAEYIQSLRLSHSIAIAMDHEDAIDIGLLRDVLQLLPHLREVSLNAMTIDRETKYVLPPTRPSVAHVHIEYDDFFLLDRPGVLPDIPAILACFDEIHTVTLNYCNVDFDLPPGLEASHPLSVHRLPVVQRLKLIEVDNIATDLPALLSRSMDTAEIQTLTLCSDESEHAELFEFLSPSLKRLYIEPELDKPCTSVLLDRCTAFAKTDISDSWRS